MRTRALAIFVLLCSCNEQKTPLRYNEDAAASDGRPDALADAAADDMTPSTTRDSSRDAASDDVVDQDAKVGPEVDSAIHDDVAADLLGRDVASGDATWADGAAATVDLARDLAALDAPGAEAGSSCSSVIPGLQGATVGWMATQCNWASPSDVTAPAAAIALADSAEAMSFRVRVDVALEAYDHLGYVSRPSLTEVGAPGGPTLEVLGPTAGATQGQYFFDLRWASEMAPREGMQITLTATFSFACQPAMSRTIDATTTVNLTLCRTATGKTVWRAPGQPCAPCDTAVDGGTDGR